MSRKQTVVVKESPPPSPARRSSVTAATMATNSLPSIDFGFNDLRERMARFTIKFDEFIEQSRKRVLNERNQFRANITELQGIETAKLSLLQPCFLFFLSFPQLPFLFAIFYHKPKAFDVLAFEGANSENVVSFLYLFFKYNKRTSA
jgi:hypothetical protein